ncbi:hypothetical protein [Methanosarcina barkeri]|nr:hypothetical protein [Methanosarcina barkeri]
MKNKHGFENPEEIIGKMICEKTYSGKDSGKDGGKDSGKANWNLLNI